jgi:holo-[acyl-carrier protein] synthase
MSIIGIGTDIVETARVAGMFERHEDAFAERVFTSAEQAYCSFYKQPAERYAGRWAAKEAVLKALGTGWSGGIGWRDVEIVNEASGKPICHLSGAARQHAAHLGIAEIQVTLSHCAAYAVAFAVAIGTLAGESPLVRVPEVQPDPVG